MLGAALLASTSATDASTSGVSINSVVLTSGSSQTNGTSFVTDSINPSGSKLITLSVVSSAASVSDNVVPTASGNGLTWVKIADTVSWDVWGRVTMFRAMVASPTSGAVTISFSAAQDDCLWEIREWSDVDTGGTHGSAAVVQSATNTGEATSLTGTLAAFSDANNATFGVFGRQSQLATGEQTPGSGFSELNDFWIDAGYYVDGLQTIWNSGNDTTVDSSTVGAHHTGVVAIEITQAASASISAGLGGTALPNIGEVDIVAGGKTIIVSLINDTFIAAGTGPIGSTANTQAFIDGITSLQSELAGWNAEVRDKMLTSAVVRTNNNTATITLPVAADYSITAQETILNTIPAAVLTTSAADIVASPSLIVSSADDQYEANGDVNWLNPPSLPLDDTVSQTGGTYSISFKTIDAAFLDAIALTNCTSVTIENCLIKNAGNRGIYLNNCGNITIRNNHIHNTGLTPIANQGQAIMLDFCNDNWLIEGNWFEDVPTAITNNVSENSDNIIIRGNFAKNMLGNVAGGSGDFLAFNYCFGNTNVSITENVMRGVIGSNNVIDWISTYQSSGTAAFPIMITNNYIQGSGVDRSGGGIMVGDMGFEGDNFAGYITATGNYLVNPGQYGMAISAGNNNVISDNFVFSSQNNPNIANANVGIYVWRQGHEPPGDLFDATVSNNNVLWWSDFQGTGAIKQGSWLPTTGDDSLEPNHGTVASGNVDPTGWATNDFDHTAWDADSGNQGYTDLPAAWKVDTGRTTVDTWEYYPPS